MILCLYFRQVDPSPSNVAALSLSEKIQIRNVRKVKVNAQVSCAIYVLETFGVIFGIIWLYFGNFGVVKIASTSLYYVLLPYMYLMNTQNNKNRITDEGWTNTVRNVLGISKNLVTELPLQTQEETSNMLTSTTLPKSSKNYLYK